MSSVKKYKNKDAYKMKNTAKKDSATVVKRGGHNEIYDEKKVYASCYASALNCHYAEQVAERIARDAVKKVNDWAKTRNIISSEEIRQHIIECLDDEDVVLMYRHHLDLS